MNQMKKYLSVKDAMEYYSISRFTLMKLAPEAEALRRVGRKILIDRDVLDEYLKNSAVSVNAE